MVLFLVIPNTFWCTFTTSILITFALIQWTGINSLIDSKFQSLPRWVKVIMVVMFLFMSCSDIKAKLPEMHFDDALNAVGFHIEIDKKLTGIFDKYNIKDYEEIQKLSLNACSLENRFTLILANINRVEETDVNTRQRIKNLKYRRKNFLTNIGKIHQREIKAELKQLEITNIPDIRVSPVPLHAPYKRIMLWANEIDKNIKAPKCSKSCAFNHIDTSSIKIVEEISSIQKTQDLVNLQLTKLENEFDILEDLQQKEEIKLTQRGF